MSSNPADARPIDAALVRSLFTYRDGALYWKQRPVGAKRERAGGVMSNGYAVINCKRLSGGVPMLTHRLIWAYHYGDPGAAVIDHKDRDPLNNRIGNLRCVTQSINLRNVRRPRLRGVKHNGFSWTARIMVERRERHLGSFATRAAAVRARKRAESAYGFVV